MQSQNRAEKNIKPKGGGPQAKQRLPLPAPCREVKVVTVREVPSLHLVIDTPQRVLKLWRHAVASANWYDRDKEHLVSFSLDTRHRLKNFSLVAIGTLNESLAHPREIFRSTIVDAAKSIIVVHNHPSGDPSPSSVDVDLAERLYCSGELLKVPLLDFIIVANEKYFSFRECRWPPRSSNGELNRRGLKEGYEMTSSQLETQDKMEDAVHTSAALLEALGELLSKGLTEDCLSLQAQSVEGLHMLAVQQGANLRKRFEAMGVRVRAL
jgi:proteasome lid subunit RPN8/RPN11